MAVKSALMFLLLVSQLAIVLRFVRAQMNSNDYQGIHRSYIPLLMCSKPFLICLVKAAKDNPRIYATENKRIPLNSMSIHKMNWFSIQDRVVKYTTYPLLQGKIIHRVCYSP